MILKTQPEDIKRKKIVTFVISKPGVDSPFYVSVCSGLLWFFLDSASAF